MNRLAVIVLAAVFASSGAVGGAGQDSASALLRDASGQERATAKVTQVKDGVRVSVRAVALSAGSYGTHLHMRGRCEAPDFASSGGHWNPTKKQHGSQNPDGAHMGDLPNLVVGKNGKGKVEFVIPGASLRTGETPLLDADGASVIVHSSADDYKTDPSGNSGARMACGILG